MQVNISHILPNTNKYKSHLFCRFYCRKGSTLETSKLTYSFSHTKSDAYSFSYTKSDIWIPPFVYFVPVEMEIGAEIQCNIFCYDYYTVIWFNMLFLKLMPLTIIYILSDHLFFLSTALQNASTKEVVNRTPQIRTLPYSVHCLWYVIAYCVNFRVDIFSVTSIYDMCLLIINLIN